MNTPLYTILITLFIIVSILIILAIMMQPSKQNSAASAFSGGGELFGKQKARGFVAVMQRITTVLLIIWFLIAIALAYLSSH